MLCKAKDIEIFSEWAFNGSSVWTSKTFTVQIKGKYILNMIKCYWNGYGYKYSIKVNDTIIWEFERQNDYREPQAESFTHIVNLDVWDIVTYTIYGRGSGTWFCKWCNAIYQTQEIRCFPKGLYLIWVKGYATLYGRHTDNKYYGGVVTWKTTTVTTGEITLGNAVGFLEINYNGEIVKVPYYS